MNHFFAYMARMKLIRRWSLMKSVSEENIAEHSAQVAQIAHGLAVIKNRRFGGTLDADRIGMMALYHETSEVLTGDLPTPIKYYNPEIRKAYKDIEGIANEKLLRIASSGVHNCCGFRSVDEFCAARCEIEPAAAGISTGSTFIGAVPAFHRQDRPAVPDDSAVMFNGLSHCGRSVCGDFRQAQLDVF